MIKGLGTDILEISRFKKILEKHPERFMEKLLNEEERAYCLKHKDSVARLAARFSAKEAISKALGCGIGQHLSFKDMIIDHEPSGKPFVRFSKKAEQYFQSPRVEISISHCQKYVTATAIWI